MKLFALGLCLTLFLQSPTLAADAADTAVVVSPIQVISLYREGKLQEAVDLQEKIAKQEPKIALNHALLSFLYWQMGNAPDAIVEGQKAVRYAPQDETYLLNLAHMFQITENYAAAAPVYERAQKVEPKNWLPGVCLSRCYAKGNQAEKALEVLKQMSALADKNFDWNLQLGNAYLLLDKPGLAVPHLKTALSGATDTAEKSVCSQQLLLALLRDNQVSQAKEIADGVFEQYHPKNSELYVRTASAVLPPDSPESAKKLLKTAIQNLANTQDSDGFFRLGQIFDQRGWLEIAAEAFNQAIELNPGQAQYHEALAGVLWREGKTADAGKELAEAQSYDHLDQLSTYLISKTQQSSPNLSAVKFKINGATCGCQITKLGQVFPQIKGVVFANVIAMKPYSGIVLIDQSQLSAKDVFAKSLEISFGHTELKEPLTFEVQSEQAVKTISDAITIALSAKYGDVLQFPKAFDLFSPVLPASTAQSPSGVASAN